MLVCGGGRGEAAAAEMAATSISVPRLSGEWEPESVDLCASNMAALSHLVRPTSDLSEGRSAR